MSAFLSLPAQFRWSSEQLASAVPLRLSQAVNFNALRDAAPSAANTTAHRARRFSGYLAACAAPALFRVH